MKLYCIDLKRKRICTLLQFGWRAPCGKSAACGRVAFTILQVWGTFSEESPAVWPRDPRTATSGIPGPYYSRNGDNLWCCYPDCRRFRGTPASYWRVRLAGSKEWRRAAFTTQLCNQESFPSNLLSTLQSLFWIAMLVRL